MIRKKFFDIIICVHNSPRYVRHCLNSVLKSSSLDLFNVIIIDDFSDDVTKSLIQNFATNYPDTIQIITNNQNLGYVKTANVGIENSISDNVVFLNSDVIVTDNWLEKFQQILNSDSTIGLISALTNNAANLSVKMPPGFDYIHMNDFFEKYSENKFPDAMTIVGHCLLITKKVIEKIGGFDEVFSPAYTEETDYHFKAINNGFRAVVADNTYVYHKGEGSITNRNTLIDEHLKIFFSRWGEQFKKLHAEYEKQNELGYIRDQQNQLPLFEKFNFTPSYDIVFLLPSLTAGIGGIITVIEIVNGLIRSGIHANIAYIGKKQIDLELLFEPIYYETFEHFCTFPPNSKVFVATDNGTVQHVQLLSTSHHIETAYFIQDYEGWFDKKNLDFVKKTYSQIENKIVVSLWLQKMIKTNDNYDSTVINVGVPTEIFYKQNNIIDEIKELKNNCKIIVLSLLSNYERRGSKYFVQAMKEILEKYDDIGFVFTQRSHSDLIDFEDPRILNLNMVDRTQIPIYFSNCDVIVDASLYHGFGLPGLEGMSVGLAPILTNVELDYAVNNHNSILIKPKNVEELKNAIIQLYEDPKLLNKLKCNARQDSLSFDWDKLIPKYVDYFESLIQKFDVDKIRPNFGYEKYLRTKNILEIIEPAPIIQQPLQLTKKNTNPKNLLASFLYDSKKFGFAHACKESIKWIFK